MTTKESHDLFVFELKRKAGVTEEFASIAYYITPLANVDPIRMAVQYKKRFFS